MQHLAIRIRMLLLGAMLCGAASAAPVNFEIPAQPATSALMAFSQQAHVEVVFSADDLKNVQTNAVAGSLEPDAAIGKLLRNTGYTHHRNGGGKYVVTAEAAATATLRGSLIGSDGRPVEKVAIRIRETDQSALTTRNGEYEFAQVPSGTYTLIATADGYQPLHITDVRLRGGRDVILGRQLMRRLAPNDDTTKMEPYVVQAENITELDPFEVTDRKVKPFSDANIDIPRTIDDAQPYYIFDSRKIELSGATTVEDFLTNNLTMNFLRGTNTGNTTSYGANSDVNLRGLGVDRTLVLINGRRMPNTVMLTSVYQTDVNGIAPSMIDHIDVLPTSASGIYGGNALGGVVNIVLKKNYSGGELGLNYANTWHSDASRKSVSLSWGQGLEDGRTQFQISARYSDGTALRMQDRASIIRNNYAAVIRNFPDQLYTQTSPFAGATTNITNSVAANLILDNGTALNSRITHISAGMAPAATPAQLNADLAANAGTYNLDLPSIYWLQTGLGNFYGFTPMARSFNASVTRKMTSNIEMFVDYSFTGNRAEELYSSYFSSTRTIPADANPFTTPIIVKVPAERLRPRIGIFNSQSLTIGAKVTLPHDWIGQLDYTWVDSKNDHRYEAVNDGAINAALAARTINPFVDTQLYPISLDPFATFSALKHGASQDDIVARAYGPLMQLPWGTPTLAVGLENRLTGNRDGSSESFDENTGLATSRTYYLGLKQIYTNAYAELQMPLVERGRIPGIHVLELQLAGRAERVEATTGTATASVNTTTGAVSWGSPNVGGQPIRQRDRYDSTNPTIGLKYQPVPSVTLRGSYATGFQPPTAAQLIRNPEPSTTTTQVNDPMKGTTYGVLTIGGGNPGVKP